MIIIPSSKRHGLLGKWKLGEDYLSQYGNNTTKTFCHVDIRFNLVTPDIYPTITLPSMYPKEHKSSFKVLSLFTIKYACLNVLRLRNLEYGYTEKVFRCNHTLNYRVFNHTL